MTARYILSLLATLFLIMESGYCQNSAGAVQSRVQNPHGKIKWECIDCHTTDSWEKIQKSPKFDHAETGFPLVGTHAAVYCMSCHESPKFELVGSNCADCHTDVHKGEFGINCQTCHTAVSWEDHFDVMQLHAARGFPLVGSHAIADCQSCHIYEQRNEFAGTATACFSCHIETFNATVNPNHVQAGFSMNCESCHQTAAISWKENVQFEHTADFPLRGAHKMLECRSCHEETFVATPNECVNCHEQDYQSVEFPNHVAMGFPTDCATCHNESQWQRGLFDHVAASGFALNGTHANIRCVACHVDNQLTGLPRDCFGCHNNDYQNVTNPNHVTGNFPTDCMVCHNEVRWSPADFDHNQTNFPLTGAHVTLLCENCHEGGNFTALPTDCYSCHQSDYEDVNDPNHIANNFSTDCTQCHSTAAWEPATFDHNNTDFPLTGAHIGLDCLSCHSSGYAGTPTACVSCHESDYQNTTDPNHAAANFPLTCKVCHTTTAWEPANWNHDQLYFPIYSGKHRNEWNTCADCHVDQTNFAVFECIFCHEHNQSKMDDEHNDVNGYVYQSTACYNCHPNGEDLMKLDRIRDR